MLTVHHPLESGQTSDKHWPMGYLWRHKTTPDITVMEENRARLRRKTGLLLLVIYLGITGFMVIAYFIQNDLEQDGIVYDTQLERGITTLLFCLIWTIASYQLYKNIMRAFDRRSQVFDEQEMRIRSTREAARLREQFMANMSHEIRTPLNAIIGFSTLLSRENLDQRQQEMNASILLASENLLTIVNDILDLSKIEAGKITLEHTEFELPGLLYSLQQMFMAKAEEKNLSLDFDLAPDLPEHLVGDPTRVTQILVNLIGNALKFTRRGGVLLRATVADQNSEQVSIQLEVQDSGIGIAKDKLDQIFERFIQADANTTRVYGGTGLGLAIVKQLVRAMQGSIEVESTPGKGANFIVQLPFQRSVTAPEKAHNSPATPSLGPSTARLLVAEDNPMNQRVLQLLFEEWQVPYTLVENGRQVLEFLERSPTAFDLILMDIQMPEMDGYEATRRIRQELQLDLPIVAMTAHVLTGERDKCLRLGMNDYISKPIREAELRELIQRFTDGTAAAPDAPQIDRVYLKETFGDNPEQLRELAGIFLQEVPKELDGIQAALAAADFERAGKIAHSMKSTVGYMGFAENIGALLGKFEQACQSNPAIETLQSDFERIRKAVDSAKVQVSKAFPK